MKPVGVAYLLFLALAVDAMPNYGSNAETCKKLAGCLNSFQYSLPTLCPRYNKDFVFVQDDCAKFDQSITSLKESMAKFCDPKMYSEYGYGAGWSPLEPMDLGNIDMSVTTPQNYRLPQSVPGTANEVLIYVWIKVRTRMYNVYLCSTIRGDIHSMKRVGLYFDDVFILHTEQY